MLLSIAHKLVVLSYICSLANALARLKTYSRSFYTVKESHQVPRGWSHVRHAPASHEIQLQIGLTQGQFAELQRHLYEGTGAGCYFHRSHVLSAIIFSPSAPFTRSCADIALVSDPKHPRYGQYLTGDEVNQLIQPTNDTIDAIHEWLHDNNITSERLRYSPAKDWISVTLPVDAAEKLLDTRFSVFVHEDGSHLVRTAQYSLPAHLHGHVQTIQPTTTFFRPRTKKSLKNIPGTDSFGSDLELARRATTTKPCNASAVTITCLRTLYGMILWKSQRS
jgi:tripeptidyl-peptidase-1